MAVLVGKIFNTIVVFSDIVTNTISSFVHLAPYFHGVIHLHQHCFKICEKGYMTTWYPCCIQYLLVLVVVGLRERELIVLLNLVKS